MAEKVLHVIIKILMYIFIVLLFILLFVRMSGSWVILCPEIRLILPVIRMREA